MKFIKPIYFIAIFLIISNTTVAQTINISNLQKYSRMITPKITKDDVIIPTYENLMNNVKKTQPVNGFIYTTTCKSTNSSCFYSVENKQHNDRKVYIFENNKINSIILGKKDNQVYKRPTENKEFPQEFSDGVSTYIDFYSSGAIHTIRQFGNNGKVTNIPVGTWYAYSEDGKILNTMEHDQHFKMNFYDILKIAERKDLPDFKISRKFNDINSFWYIYLKPHYKDNITKSRQILVDDKTGNIIYDIDKNQEKQLQEKNYENLGLTEENLKWLKNNDLHQISDRELYVPFGGRL